MHEISILYGEIYRFGTKVSKRDRFGIHKTIEDECLHALRLAIAAALEQKQKKAGVVKTLSIQIEMLKHLVRCAHETGSILLPGYIELQKRLQGISRMATGWLKYCERNETAD